MPEDCQLKPGETVPPIESISTNTGKTDRRKGKKELKKLRHKLADLQHRLYAEGRRKLLVVFQAMDAGGKDGTTRRVFDGVNPQGVQVTSFKNPTSEELRHDFLWRIHRAVPAAGMIGVFNRSHYEDVLVARVDKLVPETVWKARYEHINHFERLLTDSGTRILKFYFHVSREEQLGRLRSRLEDPRKLWKYSADDFTKRRLWPAYMKAYREVFQRCTTEWAPWHVIPADQKWYRNLLVAELIVDALTEMDPQFPEPEELGDPEPDPAESSRQGD